MYRKDRVRTKTVIKITTAEVVRKAHQERACTQFEQIITFERL